MQEESRGDTDESRPDVVLLKIIARPTGSLYSYDYGMVESKKAQLSRYLSRHRK